MLLLWLGKIRTFRGMEPRYDKKVQLDILDEIAENTGTQSEIIKIDLTEPIRKLNYDFLFQQGRLNSWDGRACVGLTRKGKALQCDLRDQFQRDARQRRINRYVKWTFWVALAGLLVTVAAFLQCNRTGDSKPEELPPVQSPAPQAESGSTPKLCEVYGHLPLASPALLASFCRGTRSSSTASR